jgi:hypothetical protein
MIPKLRNQRYYFLTQDNNSLADSPRFSAKAIRRALKALSPLLGDSTIDALIYELEKQGFELRSDRETYTIAQIQAALEDIFGLEGGSLLLTHLTKELFKDT